MRATLLFLLLAGRMTADTLILNRAWMEKFKDRATIDTSFVIDHAHKHANAPAEDGDMHVSGLAPKEVGLPMVAELMNAAGKLEKTVFDLIHANEESKQAYPMTGAWRLWFEHPSPKQVQFAAYPHASNTNPDHSFEIHPVTKYAGQDVTGSLDFVPGFPAHDAKPSFESYERQSITLRATATAVTMDAKKTGFNYALFRMKLLAPPVSLSDGGLAVLVDVIDNQDKKTVLASKVRMIFVPASGPAKLLAQGAGDGSKFDALGIPRLNLNAISAYVKAAGSVASTRKMPYELIVVGLKPVK